MILVDPTGMDTVPSNEIWEINLTNFRTNGSDGIHNPNYIPIMENGKEKYRLHRIESGENNENYIAKRIYGTDSDGNEIYSYDYIVGYDKVIDFKNGETKGSVYLRGLVKNASDNGVDGRLSFTENIKNHLERSYNPLNLIFSIGTASQYDLMGSVKRTNGMINIVCLKEILGIISSISIVKDILKHVMELMKMHINLNEQIIKIG